MKSQKISIIGCGRVGTNLAVFLSKAGYEIVGVSSRTRFSAEKAVHVAGTGRVCDSPEEAAISGDIIFITTPDHLIEEICIDLSNSDRIRLPEKTIFHCSGALSSDILSSAAERGANTGSMHPLQSFAPYSSGQTSPFMGINVSVEGDREALISVKELIHAIGANHFTIPTSSKTLYHAAAVVASNYLVTLEHFAFELLKIADLQEQKAFEILEPLIKGTLANIKSRGAVAALTGPVARGDSKVVEKHIKDIEKMVPEFSRLYKVLGQYTLKLAEKREELDHISIERLTEALHDRSRD